MKINRKLLVVSLNVYYGKHRFSKVRHEKESHSYLPAGFVKVLIQLNAYPYKSAFFLSPLSYTLLYWYMIDRMFVHVKRAKESTRCKTKKNAARLIEPYPDFISNKQTNEFIFSRFFSIVQEIHSIFYRYPLILNIHINYKQSDKISINIPV